MDSSILLVGCIAFALGVAALVAYGTDKHSKSALQAQLEVLDPATDFTKLEQSCMIRNVTWLYANQTTKRLQNPSRTVNVACVDHFVYQFALLDDHLQNNHSEELIYDSELFGVNRTQGSNPKSCNWYDSDIATTLYSPGDQVDCWMPTTPFEVDDLTTMNLYNCGNDDCVKVLDPQETWDTYYELSTSVEMVWRLPVGIVAVLVGGLCCCFAHERVRSSIRSGGG